MLVLELIFSGETLKTRKKMQIIAIKNSFSEMLQRKDFRYGLMMLGVSYGAVMFYGLSGPFILEHELGYSAIVTGYVSLGLGAGWMTGGFLSKALINKPLLTKLRVANYTQFALVLTMMLSASFLSNLFTIAIFAFLIHIAAGFTFSVYFPYCLSSFPQYAATAGGLTGGITYVLTSLFSYGVAFLVQANTQFGLAEGYLLLAVVGFFTLILIANNFKTTQNQKESHLKLQHSEK